MIVIHSNFKSGMYDFQDSEVLLPTGYEVIVSPPPGGAVRTFYEGFWKSDQDFLLVFHSNFLSGIHGFRDKDVFLQAEYVVIVISPPVGASRYFT